MIQMTALQVRALAGVPITVLVLLAVERRPLTQEYISRYTGYTDKPIHDALMLLADQGLVTATGRYTWQICGDLRQLPLIIPELDEPEAPAANDDAGSAEAAEFEDDSDDDSQISSEYFRPALRGRSINTTKPESSSLLPDLRSRSSEKIRAEENLAMLDRYQVQEPARSRLPVLPHVTPELIEHHCETAPNLSLAIYRIEHNWHAKKARPEESAGYRRYLTGPYADVGEH